MKPGWVCAQNRSHWLAVWIKECFLSFFNIVRRSIYRHFSDAGEGRGRGLCFSGCLSETCDGDILVNNSREILQIRYKYSLGLEDELIRMWCPKQKHILYHNSRIHTIKFTQMSNRGKKSFEIQKVRGETLWCHDILREMFCLLFNATAQEQRLDWCVEVK